LSGGTVLFSACLTNVESFDASPTSSSAHSERRHYCVDRLPLADDAMLSQPDKFQAIDTAKYAASQFHRPRTRGQHSPAPAVEAIAVELVAHAVASPSSRQR
jgi:hypothetical protein